MVESSRDRSLTATIDAAADYVVASGELRPRILAAVRKEAAVRQRKSRWFIAMTSAIAVLVLLAVVRVSIEQVPVPRGVTSVQLHNQADRRMRRTGVTLDWALSEVFAEWRGHQR